MLYIDPGIRISYSPVHFFTRQVAFRHDFVLSGILGLAALHQAHLDATNRKRMIADAAGYHNHLINGLQDAVAQSVEDQCDALFVSASLNIIFVFGMYGWIHDAAEGDSAHTSRFLGETWIPTVQGVAAVMQPIDQRIRSGPLAPLTDLSLFFAVDLAKDDSPDHRELQQLSSLWGAGEDEQTYDEAHHLLRMCFAYMNKCKGTHGRTYAGYCNQTLSAPLIWIFMAPNDYFRLLRERHPAALIIFAYEGVLFHRLEHVWFFRGWGQGIVNAIESALGPQWSQWTSWPRQQIGANSE